MSSNIQYNVYVNQKAIIDNNIDIALDEAVILDYLMDLKAGSAMQTIIADNKEWMWVSHSNIISNLPILGIKTTQSIRNKINRLIELGFLERYSGSVNERRSYYRLTSKCSILVFDNQRKDTPKNNLGLDKQPQKIIGSTPKNNWGEHNTIEHSIYKKLGKFNFKQTLIDLGADIQHIEDWLIVRRDKKASNTKTALNRLAKEWERYGYSVADGVKICAENSWSGFKGEWLKLKPIPDRDIISELKVNENRFKDFFNANIELKRLYANGTREEKIRFANELNKHFINDSNKRYNHTYSKALEFALEYVKNK